MLSCVKKIPEGRMLQCHTVGFLVNCHLLSKAYLLSKLQRSFQKQGPNTFTGKTKAIQPCRGYWMGAAVFSWKHENSGRTFQTLRNWWSPWSKMTLIGEFHREENIWTSRYLLCIISDNTDMHSKSELPPPDLVLDERAHFSDQLKVKTVQKTIFILVFFPLN